jgi:membrane protein implicated in regulation of membrane protease activity
MSGVMLFWVIVGTGLIISELVTGTFYLLVFGVAAWAGALAAYIGLNLPAQIGVSGTMALAGLAILIPYDIRRRKGMTSDGGDLDIGNDVSIESISDAGRLRVNYRGAGWDALVEGSGASSLKVGEICVITAVRGNTLVVRKPAS